MTKDVLVSIKGTRFFGEEDDTVEIITAGTYYEKNKRHYILYDEALEGVEEVTHNIIKIGENRVEVIKRGMVESRMTFESGKKHKANYLTPLGLILLGITTSALDVKEEESAISLHMEYSLEMNGEYVSSCETDITATSRINSVLNLN